MVDKGKLNGWIWHGVCVLTGIAFGAGGAFACLNHLSGRVNDHETRIRTVERAFGRIETKLDYLVEDSKETK